MREVCYDLHRFRCAALLWQLLYQHLSRSSELMSSLAMVKRGIGTIWARHRWHIRCYQVCISINFNKPSNWHKLSQTTCLKPRSPRSSTVGEESKKNTHSFASCSALKILCVQQTAEVSSIWCLRRFRHFSVENFRWAVAAICRADNALHAPLQQYIDQYHLTTRVSDSSW